MDLVRKLADQESKISRSIRSILYRNNKVIYQTSTGAQAQDSFSHAEDSSGKVFTDTEKCTYPSGVQAYHTAKDLSWVGYSQIKEEHESKDKCKSSNFKSMHSSQCSYDSFKSNPDCKESVDVISRLKKMYNACKCKRCACIAGEDVPTPPCPPRDPKPCVCQPCLCYDCTRISDDIKKLAFPDESENTSVGGLSSVDLNESFLSSLEVPQGERCLCQPCECVQCDKNASSKEPIKEKPILEENDTLLSKRRKFNPKCRCNPCECLQCQITMRPECRCDPKDPCLMCQGFSKMQKNLPSPNMLCRVCNTLLPVDKKKICKCFACECTESNKVDTCECDSCQCINVRKHDNKGQKVCDCRQCECVICNGVKRLCESCLESDGVTMMLKQGKGITTANMTNSCQMLMDLNILEEAGALVTDGETCSCSPCECVVCKNKPKKKKLPHSVFEVFNASVPYFQIKSTKYNLNNNSLVSPLFTNSQLCINNLYSPSKFKEDNWTPELKPQHSDRVQYNKMEYIPQEVYYDTKFVPDDSNLSSEPLPIHLLNVSTSQCISYVKHIIEGKSSSVISDGKDVNIIIHNQIAGNHVDYEIKEDSCNAKDESVYSFSPHNFNSNVNIEAILEVTKSIPSSDDLDWGKSLEIKESEYNLTIDGKPTAHSEDAIKTYIDNYYEPKSALVDSQNTTISIFNKELLLPIVNEIHDEIKFDEDFFRNMFINESLRKSIRFCSECEILKEKERNWKTMKEKKKDDCNVQIKKDIPFENQFIVNVMLRENTKNYNYFVVPSRNSLFEENKSQLPSKIYPKDFSNNSKINKLIDSNDLVNNTVSTAENVHSKEYRNLSDFKDTRKLDLETVERKIEENCVKNVNAEMQQKNTKITEKHGSNVNVIQNINNNNKQLHKQSGPKNLLKNTNEVICKSLEVAQYYSDKMTYFISKYKNHNDLNMGNTKENENNLNFLINGKNTYANINSKNNIYSRDKCSNLNTNVKAIYEINPFDTHDSMRNDGVGKTRNTQIRNRLPISKSRSKLYPRIRKKKYAKTGKLSKFPRENKMFFKVKCPRTF